MWHEIGAGAYDSQESQLRMFKIYITTYFQSTPTLFPLAYSLIRENSAAHIR
jgi:hypothetical protein